MAACAIHSPALPVRPGPPSILLKGGQLLQSWTRAGRDTVSAETGQGVS